MATTVIGIDPSFTCTGVCLWIDGRVHTFSIKTPAHTPRVYREQTVVDTVMQWVVPETTVVAVIEGVYLNRFVGRTSLDLAGLHDVLVYEFARRAHPVGVPANKSNKLFATGNGNADKKAMVAAAKRVLGVVVANDNEADALWLEIGRAHV